jgi:adenylate cyclase
VVLAFANLPGDPAQHYPVDALTDETTLLARIADSFVIVRNTVLTHRGKPVDAYVLEGSVQPSGTQMMPSSSTPTGRAHLYNWTPRPRADLLQTQDETVTRLARALDLQTP